MKKITRYFLFDTVDDLEYFIENKYGYPCLQLTCIDLHYHMSIIHKY